MSIDVRQIYLEAAAAGTISLQTWRDPEGNIVDTWATPLGAPFEDQGVSARLSEQFGTVVSHTGEIAASEATELAIIRRTGAM